MKPHLEVERYQQRQQTPITVAFLWLDGAQLTQGFKQARPSSPYWHGSEATGRASKMPRLQDALSPMKTSVSESSNFMEPTLKRAERVSFAHAVTQSELTSELVPQAQKNAHHHGTTHPGLRRSCMLIAKTGNASYENVLCSSDPLQRPLAHDSI